MTRLAIRAPGKALLSGEYGVLHGAPAIAVAVDRLVIATEGPGGEESPFVRAAKSYAAKNGGAQLGDVRVDSTALYENGEKLGLGSSAAVTAAVVGLAMAKAERTLEPHALFAVADAAHAEAQGTRGSGVDVAVSVYGGTIRFVRKNGNVDVRSVDLPDNVRLTFIWAGQPASTGDMIARVKALAESQPARHEAAIGRLVSQAHAFATAVAANDPDGLIRAADAYGIAMAALGEAAEIEIVTRPHSLLAALARRHGGAAKPSGAGGGDLGVAFTVGNEATTALRKDAQAAGLTVLSLGAPAPGLRLENA
ncbi:MAG: phosphomevalonate kinase [Myxococcales bacterium]|nr:phosphomevalonate kinase [Myxococcales bacterium]